MWSVTHKDLKSGGGVCPALASRKKKQSEQMWDAHIRSTSAITKFCISLHVFLSPFTLKASCLTSSNGVYLDGLLTIDGDLLLHSERTGILGNVELFQQKQSLICTFDSDTVFQWSSVIWALPLTVVHVKASFSGQAEQQSTTKIAVLYYNAICMGASQCLYFTEYHLAPRRTAV